MMKVFIISSVLLWYNLAYASLIGLESLLTKFAVEFVKTQQSVIFICDRQGLFSLTSALLRKNQLIQMIKLTKNISLPVILTHRNHARTAVIVDGECNESAIIFQQIAKHRYFNKTYQWFLSDTTNRGLVKLLPHNLDYLGPNAQITYLNSSHEGYFTLWDIHSKGIHLGSPLEVELIAKWNISTNDFDFLKSKDFLIEQSIKNRDQFNGLRLRGSVVIDQDNIVNNDQINRILSEPGKSTGVATFVKYSYHFLCLLSDRFNFTVNFRNSRGWSGYIANTTYRLGLLGVLARHEADITATASFFRKDRFADIDTVHASWKFEAGFLYRFTPDLVTRGKSGNFLAPFNNGVWGFSLVIFFVINFVWFMVERPKTRWLRDTKASKESGKEVEKSALTIKNEQHVKQQPCKVAVGSESKATAVAATTTTTTSTPTFTTTTTALPTSFSASNIHHSYCEVVKKRQTLDTILLNTLAAVCQQGLDKTSHSLPVRAIILTTFTFTLLMYNFYTSSVVGGLLSSTEQGPATLADIIESPLKLSFDDVGYNKILFQETKNSLVKEMHKIKIAPKRGTDDLPPFVNANKAIPFIKQGGYAYHCELIETYPLINKLFDAEDICDLRVVTGLLETGVANWPISRRSQYLELFRIVMIQAKEAGLINRNLEVWVSKKPECRALYRAFPINMAGVLNAFYILLGSYMLAILALIMEIKYKNRSRIKEINPESIT